MCNRCGGTCRAAKMDICEIREEKRVECAAVQRDGRPENSLRPASVESPQILKWLPIAAVTFGESHSI